MFLGLKNINKSRGKIIPLALLLIHMLSYNSASASSEEANFWYFGSKAGLDFSKGYPVAINNSSMDAMEGVASISSSAGDLLFYTDGMRVWNKSHRIMVNGYNLDGHQSSTQSGVIVPKPGSSNIFYIFTVDEVGGPHGFRYSVVDISLQNGEGEIIEKNKLLHVPSTEKVTAVRHANNRDIWVIAHQWNTNEFHTYLISEKGIIRAPKLSACGIKHNGNIKNAIGYLKASPNGNKLAHAIRDMNIVEIFDFNKATGLVANPKIIKNGDCSQPYGIEFSPDGSKLYVTYSRPGSTIIQYNLNDDDFEDTYYTVAENDEPNLNFALQLGPDGKIYVAKYRKTYLSSIGKPNKSGWRCNYTEKAVKLGGAICNLGLPTFVQSYFMDYKKFVDSVTIDVPFSFEADFIPGSPRISIDTLFKNGILTVEYIYKRTDTVFNKREFKNSASVIAVGIDNNGRLTENPILRIEEFYSNKLHPLLNYIFFGHNSDVLDEKYVRISASASKYFDIADYSKYETLNIYYHLLNIVGQRMRERPDAILKLVGCNSGIDEEEQNIQLSQSRAVTVKEYLKHVWNISDNRFVLEYRNLPDQLSFPPEEDDKAAENRRVELYSDDEYILKPVFTSDTIRKANFQKLKVFTNFNSDAGINSYRITINQEHKKILEYNSESDTLPAIEWEIEKDQALIPRSSKPLEIKVDATDRFQQHFASEPRSVNVKQITLQHKNIMRIADKEIDQFSLILFSFSKSRLNDKNLEITEFIQGRVKPNSTIKIFGFTDRTGQKSFNRDLSWKRAEQVKKELGFKKAQIFGIGEDKLLYDNDKPEGRFYCRTVNIILETPLDRNIRNKHSQSVLK